MRDEIIKNTLTLNLVGEEEPNILDNDGLVQELAEIWTGHQNALELLARYMNAATVKYIVEKAEPVEIIGLRHEIVGVEKVVAGLGKIAAEWERRRANPKAEPIGEAGTL